MPLQQLRTLLEKHCTTLRDQMAAFEAAYRHGGPDRAAMGILHSLKGNSGTMGFADIHGQVVTLERLLRDCDATSAEDTDTLIAAIRSAIAEMRPEQSRHYNLKI